MGLLSFKKKALGQTLTTTPNHERFGSGGSAPNSEASSAVSERRMRWTPARRKVSTSAATPMEVTPVLPTADDASASVATSAVPTIPNPTILSNLSVMALDDVEVMTFESQRALMDQREAIRKKLFENNSNNGNRQAAAIPYWRQEVKKNDEGDDYEDDYDGDEDDFVHTMEQNTAAHLQRVNDSHNIRRIQSDTTSHTAKETSKEILANGLVRDGSTVVPLTTSSSAIVSPSDRFSLPLEAVSRSWSGGGGSSLQQIAEEPVDYGTPARKSQSSPPSAASTTTEYDRRYGNKNYYTGPVSVDVSYTESELASIVTSSNRNTSQEQELSYAPPNNATTITPSPSSPAFFGSTSTSNSTTMSSMLVAGGTSATGLATATPYLTENLHDDGGGDGTDEEDPYVVHPEAVETSFTGSLSPPRRGVSMIPFYGKLMAAASPQSNNGKNSNAILASTSVAVQSSPDATALDDGINDNGTTSRNGSFMVPMDERETDHVLQEFLGKGKSPLKGMPEDERLEYQKDEMVPSPVKSPVADAAAVTVQDDDSVQMPEVIVNQSDDDDAYDLEAAAKNDPLLAASLQLNEQNSHSMGTTSGATSTSFGTSFGDTTTRATSSSAVVPELARSILLAAMQCGSGALDNASKTMDSCGAGGMLSGGVNGSGAAVGGTLSTDVSGGATSGGGGGTTMETTRGIGIGGIGGMVNPTDCIGIPGIPNDASSEATSITPLAKRRVYLDESSTVRFLRRITNNGFVLLYLQPTSDEYLVTEADVPTDDWKGNTVTMMIQKGSISASAASHATSSVDAAAAMDVNVQAPRLEWITVTGGLVSDATTTSVNLLEIQSILTNDEDREEDEDMCFFTITDGDGDVHIFEAATLEERNRIVHGLKTIIARWSFHLIAGDVTGTAELYTNHLTSAKLNGDVDLPSLPNPSQTMNHMSHMLLDVEC